MKFKLITCTLFLTITLCAQRPSEGETYFNNKQYSKARTVYDSLLKQKPNDELYNYRFARCCYELKDVESSIEHFKMSGNKFPARDLYLGELTFNSYRFEESIIAYQTYMATLKPDDSKLPDYQTKVKRAEKAARLLNKVEDIALVDSIVVNKSDFLRFYKFSSELGTLSQELFKLKAHRNVDKIRYTTQRKDRVYYSDSIQGQMDIFTSYKLFDTWSQAVSVSSVINSSANENYPFLLLDGVTLYFASDGENSIGGYDLFITRFTPSSNTYLEPENIGMPFNSPFNDYMMVIDEQHKVGWFASDRYQPAGKVVIYTFIPNEIKTIIRSDDKDYIRRAAQLKTYRKATKNQAESTIIIENQLPESEKKIAFVINDSLVYTHVNQFKSEEAVRFWAELRKLSADLKLKIKQLEDLRIQYSQFQNESDRIAISNKIIELEKSNIGMEKQLTIKKIQITNSENKYLQKTQKP